jgi:hypothetical protein
LLTKVPLFARCSKRELAQIAALATEVNLPEGHTLMREGSVAYSFFALVEGTADVGVFFKTVEARNGFRDRYEYTDLQGFWW